jgi:hypothetical protein
MSTRFASCSCGQLTAQVVGEPVRVSRNKRGHSTFLLTGSGWIG